MWLALLPWFHLFFRIFTRICYNISLNFWGLSLFVNRNEIDSMELGSGSLKSCNIHIFHASFSASSVAVSLWWIKMATCWRNGRQQSNNRWSVKSGLLNSWQKKFIFFSCCFSFPSKLETIVWSMESVCVAREAAQWIVASRIHRIHSDCYD